MHVERDPFHLSQFRLQIADDLRRSLLALIARLQIDLDASAVRRDVGSIDANERSQAVDIRVLQNHAGQFLLLLRHGCERNVLRSLGDPHDHARILHRKEALGYVHIKKQRGD